MIARNEICLRAPLLSATSIVLGLSGCEFVPLLFVAAYLLGFDRDGKLLVERWRSLRPFSR
jgi:hypothetical protein